MKKLFFFCTFVLISISSFSQNDYFFPSKKLNEKIPTPEAFLGYKMGSHHTRYDKLVEYMRLLESVSDRVKVMKIGETNEHRDQIIVHFGTKENLLNIEKIREQHLDFAAGKKAEINEQKVVVWLGYNVHGNEASGAEASILTAYYLAAIDGQEASDIFKNAVFLMEPVVNPDGRDRFSNWVNMHKGDPYVTDPLDREHNEVWPSGRVNHYWFDLNRDWYLSTQKETQNRIAFYHKWLPNVVTDFHEMGTNSTHFFEPTKLNAENPIVPQSNYRVLNETFAKYFEKALNDIGSLYFSKEAFDNFYPGYGNTYPDLLGGLGLLFEQGSSRGHAQESENGVLTFNFAVRNQLVNAIATIKAATEQRELLLKHQVVFFKEIKQKASKEAIKGYVIGHNLDVNRNDLFRSYLKLHQIESYELSKDLKIGDQVFEEGKGIYIPLEQDKNLFVKSIFERPKSFADSIFYDTSAWNLALAYGLPHSEVKAKPELDGLIKTTQLIGNDFKPSNYAYLLDWRLYNSPRALSVLLSNGIIAKTAARSFGLADKAWPQGTVMIPVQPQKMNSEQLFNFLKSVSEYAQVPFVPVSTGYSQSGIDLGSNNFKAVKPIKPIMLIGQGTSQYEAGEVWHLFDTKLSLPITKVDLGQTNRVNLFGYTHLVMVSGNYSELSDEFVVHIKDWVKKGGVLVAIKSGAEWAIKNGLAATKLVDFANPNAAVARTNFEDVSNQAGAKNTGGAIFETDVDITHPIGYGLGERKLAVYKNSNLAFETSKKPGTNVSVYTAEPWISGYLHPDNLKKIKNSTAIFSESIGGGTVVLFADNPNFRGTWFGTNKLFFNALFMSSTLENTRFGNEEE